MTTLKTSGHPRLEHGWCVLEVLSAKPINDHEPPQLQLELRVAEGESEGYTFRDYPNLAEDGSVKVDTKACKIIEACLDTLIAPDDEVDTDHLVGKRFSAYVMVKRDGKDNRTEFGFITRAPRG